MSISEPGKLVMLMSECPLWEEGVCLLPLPLGSQHENRAVKFCFWPQFPFIPYPDGRSREAQSPCYRWHHRHGPPKLVSLQGPLLLREFGGTEFGKNKEAEGQGQGHGVEWVGGGQRRGEGQGRTTDLKRAGLGGGRRQD